MREMWQRGHSWRGLVSGLAFYAGFVLLLSVVPHRWPIDPSVASAASLDGYNNRIAHLVVVLWALVGVTGFAVGTRFGRFAPPDDTVLSGSRVTPAAPGTAGARDAIEIVAVVAGALLFYFPPFLARYGPYIEDSFFLTILHRMQSGQRPYVDFQYVYGPLTIWPMYFWTKAFGFSMTSYYWSLVVLEALHLVVLLRLLQHHIPDCRTRYTVFLTIGAFQLNTLLGVNSNGLRRLLPVVAMLLLARRPRAVGMAVTSSMILGVQLAYFPEYGVAALAAILAMYGLLTVLERDLAYVRLAAVAIGVAAAAWYTCSVLVLGADFPGYVKQTAYLIRRFDAGEQAFGFYWTVNALALFGLLCLGCIVIGRGLARPRDQMSAPGDRLLFCGLIYALVALKSGLHRSDLWHLTAPFLGLVFTFLLPWRRALFGYSVALQRVASLLVVVAAATYVFGLLPTASYYLSGLIRGLRDSVTVRAEAGRRSPMTRAPTIEVERSYPSADILRLGEYLAQGSRAERPVLFYGDLWTLGKQVGVYPTAPLTDDLLKSEEEAQGIRDFLEKRPGAIVIMHRPVYERLFGLSDPNDFPELRKRFTPTTTKAIGAWVSTVHYRGVDLELRAKERRWKRAVGPLIRSRYEVAAEFGDYMVLMPKGVGASMTRLTDPRANPVDFTHAHM